MDSFFPYGPSFFKDSSSLQKINQREKNNSQLNIVAQNIYQSKNNNYYESCNQSLCETPQGSSFFNQNPYIHSYGYKENKSSCETSSNLNATHNTEQNHNDQLDTLEEAALRFPEIVFQGEFNAKQRHQRGFFPANRKFSPEDSMYTTEHSVPIHFPQEKTFVNVFKKLQKESPEENFQYIQQSQKKSHGIPEEIYYSPEDIQPQEQKQNLEHEHFDLPIFLTQNVDKNTSKTAKKSFKNKEKDLSYNTQGEQSSENSWDKPKEWIQKVTKSVQDGVEMVEKLLEKPLEKPSYYGHRQRLKERFLKAPKAVPDYEIVELILFFVYPRQDVKEKAKEILGKYGHSLQRFIQEESRKGSPSLRFIVQLIKEIVERMLIADTKEGPLLNDSQKVLDYCHVTMGHLPHEQFRIFFLDRLYRLICEEIQQTGTIDQVSLYPREVIKRALEINATSIILIHNHPSGNTNPSKADIDLTHFLKNSLMPFNITLLDHFIVGRKSHFSFRENQIL